MIQVDCDSRKILIIPIKIEILKTKENRFPNAIDTSGYQNLIKKNPKARRWGWRLMRRKMVVYGKGRVSHRDHRTILLRRWHSIVPNRENDAWFIRETLQFLD